MASPSASLHSSWSARVVPAGMVADPFAHTGGAVSRRSATTPSSAVAVEYTVRPSAATAKPCVVAAALSSDTPPAQSAWALLATQPNTPGFAVSVPALPSTSNAVTLSLSMLATYRLLPSGLSASWLGASSERAAAQPPEPPLLAQPAEARPPLGCRSNATTRSLPELAAYTRRASVATA